MLILLFVLSSQVKLFRAAKPFDFSSADAGDRRIITHERRLAQLKKELPAHGIVGYVTDVEAEGLTTDATAAREFFFTRYVLAPLIVVNSTDPELVIGNFRGAFPETLNSGERKLTVLRDFGDGIFLFRSEAR